MTLFLAGPLLLAALYLGFSSLKPGLTFGEWIGQPKAVAFWVCIALSASVVFIELNSLLN